MNKDNFINEEKLKECVWLLKGYFADKGEKLAEVEYPSNMVYGSEEWLRYVFYSCLLDYGMRSKIYHRNLMNTYETYPHIFRSQYVVDKYIGNEDELLKILKENVHPRYPNIAVNKWVSLSSELIKYDKLRDTIVGLESFDNLNKFIRGINGYGQKTGGLLIRLISDANICDFNDEIGAIPLDRHDIEICYLNGIINKDKLSDKEIGELSTRLIEFGNQVGVSPSNVDKYLWEIGNSFCSKKKCEDCPLRRGCKTKVN